MLSTNDAMRLAVVQQRLIAATYREIKKDGHHKSSEGAMTLVMHLPNAFEQQVGVSYSVEAYSYLLNPEGRLSSWEGKTPSEAISKAEDAISEWVEYSEMEEFEGHFSLYEEEAMGEMNL